MRYVRWRDGKPRFAPSAREINLGFGSFDLKHDDGRWFTEQEAEQFSVEIFAKISDARTRAATAGRQFTKRGSFRAPANINGYVYFLKSGERVKIGFSLNPFARASTLKTGLSHGVSAMVFVPGSRRDEARAHRMLASYRQHGEWFDSHPKVVAVMMRSLHLSRIPNEEQPQNEPCDISVARATKMAFEKHL